MEMTQLETRPAAPGATTGSTGEGQGGARPPVVPPLNYRGITIRCDW